jgi:hypothetical protein
MPDVLNWSIDAHETGQHFLKFTSKERAHSSEGVGEGVISLFVIISALYDSSPGETIIIDEPELSLHPQIQRRVADLLAEFAADRQIVIATHSPFFISTEGLRQGARIARTWDREDTIKIFQSDADAAAGALRKLLTVNVNNPHVFGLDAKEAFFLEDRVLIFEGQEDVVLWPNVVEDFDGQNYNTYGWGAGGAANITNLCAVLSSLGYKRVGAVLDNDRPEDLESLGKAFPEYLFLSLPAGDIRTKPAVKPRPAKKGVLDEAMRVREEYRRALEEIHRNLNSYMDPVSPRG